MTTAPSTHRGAPGATNPATACEMLEWRLRQDPEAPVVMTAHGPPLSYADLDRRVDDLARRLRHLGIGPGATVGLYLWNDPSWVVSAFACWRLGAALAACGGLTPWSEAQRRFALAGVGAVVATADVATPTGWPTLLVLSSGVIDGRPPAVAQATVDQATVALPNVTTSPDDTAAVFFTSGTTGRPKAIVYRHRKLAAGPRMTAGAYSRSGDFRPRTTPGAAPALSFNPFGHVAGMGRLLFRMWVGRPVLLISKFDVAVVRDLAGMYPLDTLQLTPAMVHALAFTEESITLGSLRYVSSGTAPLPTVTRDAFEARYGVPVLQAYGSTEGGVTALERYEDVTAGRRGAGAVGRVSPNTPMRIVDPESRDVVPGEDGEILGRPGRDAEISLLSAGGITPLPTDAGGWYHTGDIGHVDGDGILHITGRLKEMMIVGGFNVYPTEVEEALRESPLVRDVIVVPLPDDRLGEVPIAGVVWSGHADRHDIAALEERLIEQCSSKLERYKVPRRWFSLDEVPLTDNGKVDRRRGATLGAAAVAEGAG